DGRRVLTYSSTTATISGVVSGASLVVLKGHEELLNSAVFSPDGTRVVTASGGHESLRFERSDASKPEPNDKTARIWDASTGSELVVLRGHEAQVNSAAFSPDGARVVTTSGIADSTSRRERFPERDDGAAPRDSKKPTDNTARIWDAASG